MQLCSFLTIVVLSLTTPSFGQFVYVANDETPGAPGDVSGYTIDSSTGALIPISGSPFAAEIQPISIVVDPTIRFVYVVNAGSTSVSGYMIDSKNGALTPIPGSPFATINVPESIAVDPTGRFAYVANTAGSNVSGYLIDPASGALTPIHGSPFAAGLGPNSVAIDATGRFVYVTNVVSNNVSGYALDPTTGALTPLPGSPFATGSTATLPSFVGVDPEGNFAYVANEFGSSATSVSGFAINAITGTLKPVSGSPFADVGCPHSIAVDPRGKFAYSANECTTANGVSAYVIDTSMGALTPVSGSPFASGNTPKSVAVDPTSKFAYVANAADSNIWAYTTDPSTGALMTIPGSPFASGIAPLSVAVSPLLTVAAIPNSGSGDDRVFAFRYSDAKGYKSLSLMFVSFSPTAHVEHACHVEYVRSSNKLYLKNDEGTAFLGPVTPGVTGTVSNSQCTLDAGRSSVFGSQNTLTLNLTFRFKPAFAGLQGISLYAIDEAGVKTPGREKRGIWRVTP